MYESLPRSSAQKWLHSGSNLGTTHLFGIYYSNPIRPVHTCSFDRFIAMLNSESLLQNRFWTPWGFQHRGSPLEDGFLLPLCSCPAFRKCFSEDPSRVCFHFSPPQALYTGRTGFIRRGIPWMHFWLERPYFFGFTPEPGSTPSRHGSEGNRKFSRLQFRRSRAPSRNGSVPCNSFRRSVKFPIQPTEVPCSSASWQRLTFRISTK